MFGIRKGTECAVLCCVLSFLAGSFCWGAAGFIAAAALSGMGYGLGGMVAATIIINRFFAAGKQSEATPRQMFQRIFPFSVMIRWSSRKA